MCGEDASADLKRADSGRGSESGGGAEEGNGGCERDGCGRSEAEAAPLKPPLKPPFIIGEPPSFWGTRLFCSRAEEAIHKSWREDEGRAKGDIC